MRRPGRSSLVAAALLASLLAPFAALVPAAADKIADKRAEARRIAAEIDRNGERISQLDEELNAAQLRHDQLASGIADAQARADAAARVTRDLRDGLDQRAAALYVGGNANVPDGATDSQSTAAAAVYTQALSARDQNLIDDYRRAREEEAARKRTLQKAQRDVEALQRVLTGARRKLEAADAEQRTLLAKVQGELGRLVHEEEARQQRAREAAARRKMEA